MSRTHIRPMRRDDWVPTSTGLTDPDGKTFAGFARSDGQGGNPLFKALPNDTIETQLSGKHRALRERHPTLEIARYHVLMPYWDGVQVPEIDDYTLVDSPRALTTTTVTVLLVPSHQITGGRLGFHFNRTTLRNLRDRLHGTEFRGVVGNLGYFMTSGLIGSKFRWSHNTRYPDHPLPELLSYIGFHWRKDPNTHAVFSAFEGAHPSTVAIRANGNIEIIHDLGIDGYTVRLGDREILIDTINALDASEADVVAFTPALHTPETDHYIAEAERSRAASLDWQTYAPFIPLDDAAERIHIFIANQGDGHMPREQVVVAWEGVAPLPSFGAILSLKRAYFAALFGSLDAFNTTYRHKPVQIIPAGKLDFTAYQVMLGGLVPAVIDGQHLYHVATVPDVLSNLSHFGNALSPIAQAGRETRNFDPYVREPAGLLIQTQNRIGWVLFEGRHEFSIGASLIDVVLLLTKLEKLGYLAGESVWQASFIDGGSAMKIYDVSSTSDHIQLEPLIRAAAGARIGPNLDYVGLNLYSTLALALMKSPVISG